MRISVVIPTLNEARHIAGAVRSSLNEGADEVIVSDGGSVDGTFERARKAGAEAIPVLPGQRARQMNAGAESTTGDLLIFLHADSRFEDGAIASLRRCLKDRSIIGGGFRRRFKTSSLLLKTTCMVGNWRAGAFGLLFGDQAIFCRRKVFLALGGYPEVGLFEDFDFSRMMRASGKTVLVAPGIVTSARRFRSGPASRTAKDVWLTIQHLRGKI